MFLPDEGERRRRIGLVFLDFDGGDLGAGADLAGREHRGSDAVGACVGDAMAEAMMGCEGARWTTESRNLIWCV